MRRLLSEVLRKLLLLLPGNGSVRVLSGPLRGAKWMVDAGPHGCWTGLYERANQQVFEAGLRPGDAVLDVGANAGFFTLLGSRLVGSRGAVIAIEPNPVATSMLRRHLTLNGSANVVVVESAASNRPGNSRLRQERALSMGRLDEGGDRIVHCTTLDEVVERWELAPRLVKLDVEGHEVQVLEGATGLLRRAGRPGLLIETHGSARHSAVLQLLRRLKVGIAVAELDSRTGSGRIVCAPDRGETR